MHRPASHDGDLEVVDAGDTGEVAATRRHTPHHVRVDNVAVNSEEGAPAAATTADLGAHLFMSLLFVDREDADIGGLDEPIAAD